MRGSLLLICFYLTYSSLAQVNTDSLRSIWENIEETDSIRLEAINKLAWEGYLFSQPDSAYLYAQEHYEFADANGYKKEMAIARNTQGTALYYMGNYPKAIKQYFESLKLKSEIKDTVGIAVSLINVGMLFEEQGLNDEAIANYYKAIESIKSIKSEHSRKMESTLAASYQNLGVIYTDTNPELALEYFYKALDIADSLGLKRDQAYAYNNLANIYSDHSDKSKALEYYERGLAIMEKLGDTGGSIDGLLNIGIYYLETGDYNQAISYANRVIKRAQKYEIASGIRDANELLYECYKALGNAKKALGHFEKHIKLKDSLRDEMNKKEVIRQTYKYNYEKQAAADSIAFATSQQIKNIKIAEQESLIKAERAEHLMLYSVVGMLVIISVFIFFVYRRNMKTSQLIADQKKEVEAQRDQIQKQHKLLEEQNREITAFNNNLEELVAERTNELENSLNQIQKYQHDLAHNIRAPYVTLMGLINLIEDGSFDSEENLKVIKALRETGEKITVVLKDISKELNATKHTNDQHNPSNDD